MIVADEQHLTVIFYLEDMLEKRDGTTVRVVGPESTDEPHAIVRFTRMRAHYHGAPNDEAFSGHPLAKRGLQPYGAFEVHNSTWAHSSKEMNRVHRHHNDEAFVRLRHFILSFHDSVFECLARGYEIERGKGSILSAARLFIEKQQNEYR